MKFGATIAIFLFTSSFLAFTGCHHSDNDVSKGISILQLIPKGIYINAKYRSTLIKTKSLYAAQQSFWETKGEGSIDQVSFVNGSFINSYGLHEGGFELPVTMIDSFNFIAKNANDTSIIIKGKFNNDYQQLIITQAQYNGYESTTLSFVENHSIYDFMHETLLAKKYLAYDSSGSFIDTVLFTHGGMENNAKIIGLADRFKSYQFFYDFNGPGMNVDEIELSTPEKQPDGPIYGWKINNDTLSIYKLVCAELMDSTDKDNPNECMDYKNGFRLLKLIKAK